MKERWSATRSTPGFSSPPPPSACTNSSGKLGVCRTVTLAHLTPVAGYLVPDGDYLLIHDAADYLAPGGNYLLVNVAKATWHHATCTIWHLITVIPGATWRANDSGKVALSQQEEERTWGTWHRPLWVLPSPGSHTPARRRQ